MHRPTQPRRRRPVAGMDVPQPCDILHNGTRCAGPQVHLMAIGGCVAGVCCEHHAILAAVPLAGVSFLDLTVEG